jgi:hypothetical protein
MKSFQTLLSFASCAHSPRRLWDLRSAAGWGGRLGRSRRGLFLERPGPEIRVVNGERDIVVVQVEFGSKTGKQFIIC